jgi:hypothetical protein
MIYALRNSVKGNRRSSPGLTPVAKSVARARARARKGKAQPLSQDSDEPGLSVIATFWSKKVGSSTSRIEKPAYDQNRIGTKGIYIQNSFKLCYLHGSNF